jgi:hypothetical protein
LNSNNNCLDRVISELSRDCPRKEPDGEISNSILKADCRASLKTLLPPIIWEVFFFALQPNPSPSGRTPDFTVIAQHARRRQIGRQICHTFPASVVGQKRTNEESLTSVMVVRGKRAFVINDLINDLIVNRQRMKSFGVCSVRSPPSS